MNIEEVQRRLWKEMILYTIKKNLESRMLGNLHVRFGVGGGVQFPALHHGNGRIPPSYVDDTINYRLTSERA